MSKRFIPLAALTIAGLGAWPAISHGQETFRWETRLTSDTQLIIDRFPSGEGSKKEITFIFKKATGNQQWKFDAFNTEAVQLVGPFSNDEAFIFTKGHRFDILYIVNFRRREAESIWGVRSSFCIDRTRRLFAFLNNAGEIFLNHQRIFPTPVNDVHYGEYNNADHSVSIPDSAYTLRDGNKEWTAGQDFVAQGYYPYSALIVKENLDLEIVLLKSKIGRVGRDSYTLKPEEKEYCLIEAHPENPDPNAPGRWTIRQSSLSPEDASAKRAQLNQIMKVRDMRNGENMPFGKLVSGGE